VAATLSEAVIMLIAMTVAARWVIRRFEVPQKLFDTLSIGLIAMRLLFPAEIAGVVWVRGLSLREYLASFVTGPRRHLTADVSGIWGDADACDAGWVSFPA
jgi:hypothetical protein